MAERTSHYDSWLHLESRIELHSDDGTVSRLFKQADLKTDVLGRVFRVSEPACIVTMMTLYYNYIYIIILPVIIMTLYII